MEASYAALTPGLQPFVRVRELPLTLAASKSPCIGACGVFERAKAQTIVEITYMCADDLNDRTQNRWRTAQEVSSGTEATVKSLLGARSQQAHSLSTVPFLLVRKARHASIARRYSNLNVGSATSPPSDFSTRSPCSSPPLQKLGAAPSDAGGGNFALRRLSLSPRARSLSGRWMPHSPELQSSSPTQVRDGSRGGSPGSLLGSPRRLVLCQLVDCASHGQYASSGVAEVLLLSCIW